MGTGTAWHTENEHPSDHRTNLTHRPLLLFGVPIVPLMEINQSNQSRLGDTSGDKAGQLTQARPSNVVLRTVPVLFLCRNPVALHLRSGEPEQLFAEHIWVLPVSQAYTGGLRV